MLALILFFEGKLAHFHLIEGFPQFVPEDPEGLGKVFLIEDGPRTVHRDEQKGNHEKEGQYFSFFEHIPI